MNRRTITKLTDDPSKEQEIQYFKEIADVPDNTYLKSFFTPALIKQFITSVTDDVCFDILDDIKYANNQRNSADVRASDAEKRLDKVDKELEHKKNAINMYKLELDKVNTKIKELERECDRLQIQNSSNINTIVDRDNIIKNLRDDLYVTRKTRCPNLRLFDRQIR